MEGAGRGAERGGLQDKDLGHILPARASSHAHTCPLPPPQLLPCASLPLRTPYPTPYPTSNPSGSTLRVAGT